MIRKHAVCTKTHTTLKQFFTFLVFCWATSTWAQTITVEGFVKDTAGVPMEMVSVALLDVSDSSLTHFGITNSKGIFSIANVYPGRYVLQSSFMGFGTISQEINVSAEGVSPSISNVVMEMQSNVLSEIIIQGERIPIVINKDTVSYDAGAFKVGADETAEDLLRRLPGLEVDPDGRVTAQGEEVKKVLVDGKEFFGGNVQLATQNLPADAIKKVKVYDRQSEDAMFTGVDDGERDKTIDFELKEDRKKGVFGDVEGSIASDDRYRIKGGVHAFNPKSRLSLLGNANNLNQLGFNYNDLMSIAGQEPGRGRGVTTSSGAPPMNWDGPNTGVYSSVSSGLNFNYDPSKRHRLNANYFLAYTDHRLSEAVDQQEFNRDRIVKTEEDNRERNIRLRHQAFGEYRFDADTNNRLEVTVNASMEANNQRHGFETKRSMGGEFVIQEGSRTVNRLKDDLNINARINFIHKFKKEGRNIQWFSSATRFNEDVNEQQTSNFSFPQDQSRSFLVDQLRDDVFQNNSLTNTLTFNEPLSDKHRLRFDISNQLRKQTHRIDVNDVFTGMFVDSLSPDFTLDYMRSYAAASYVYSIRKGNELTFTLNASQFQQGASDIRQPENNIDVQTWNYLLGNLRWFRQSEGFGRTYAGFSRNVNLPSMEQWLVTPDFRNPIFIREGNAELQPEVDNSFYLNHYIYNTFSQQNLSFNLSGGVTERPIVMEQEIDENFERVVRPINADELQYTLRGGTSYRFPVKRLRLFVRTGANVNYAQVDIPINGAQNLQENTGLTGTLALNNFTKGKWEVTVRGNWSMNWASYTARPELNQYFTSQNYVGTLAFRPDKKLTVRTEMDYMMYSEESFAGALAIPRWNASLSYAWTKSGDLITRISAFDLLGRNIGLQRFANANFIRQSETNLLTRYIMFSVMYKFRKQ